MSMNLGQEIPQNELIFFKEKVKHWLAIDKQVSDLESQIKDYDKLAMDYEESVKLCERQIKIKEDMIKTIKPKWYENKYLWFFGGVFFTSGTVYLAGQLD